MSLIFLKSPFWAPLSHETFRKKISGKKNPIKNLPGRYKNEFLLSWQKYIRWGWAGDLRAWIKGSRVSQRIALNLITCRKISKGLNEFQRMCGGVFFKTFRDPSPAIQNLPRAKISTSKTQPKTFRKRKKTRHP